MKTATNKTRKRTVKKSNKVSKRQSKLDQYFIQNPKSQNKVKTALDESIQENSQLRDKVTELEALLAEQIDKGHQKDHQIISIYKDIQKKESIQKRLRKRMTMRSI